MMALNPADTRIRQLIYKIGGEKHQRFINIFLNWKRLVGELLSERSHPIKLEHDTLFVGVQNSAWMQELILLKADIMQKYKSICHEELKDIIFLINTKRRPRK